MTREDINDIIKTICPNDEDFEKVCISPAYLKKELEALAVEQEPNMYSLDDAREDFIHDVYNTLDFLSTNDEANRIIDSFDRVTKCIERQPCEDAEMKKIDEWKINGKNAELWIVKGNLQVRYLGTIHNIPFPPVKSQEPCDDAISRQAVLDILEDINAETDGVGFYYDHWVEYIKNLPPVTPEQKMGHWIDGLIEKLYEYADKATMYDIDENVASAVYGCIRIVKEYLRNGGKDRRGGGDMTREEIINEIKPILEELNYPNAVSYLTQNDVMWLNENIKALEQQQSEDTINRQAVKEQMIKYGFHAPDMTVNEFVEYLPPVTPHSVQQPNEDCISRQAALDTFGLSEKSRKYGGDHSGYDTIMLYEVQDALEALPPVTPQQKTGRWIIIDDCEQFIAKCSECGRIEDSRMISKYPYCHCGAKMGGIKEC